jgi:chaperone required for assembly of F1-ATPase
MPLTRLAHSIIDGVADVKDQVFDAIMKYVGGDLLFYRAGQPDGLVAAQCEAWDPILAWARETFGSRFILTEGVMPVVQPERALAAARAVLPLDAWRLGALHAATTLTGSALLGLALMHGRLAAGEAWAAANIDEDWNMAQWGRDEMALARRAFRWEEMQAAAVVLESLRGT